MSLAFPSDDQRFGLSRRVSLPGPLRLDGGATLSPVEIAYETYGTLDSQAGNAILVCHALTGDHHLASPHPRTGKPGWWQRMVGPGKPIDTDRFFVVCANVLGSCMGSSGPASIDPATGRAWGMAFPVITIRDMVRAIIWGSNGSRRWSADRWAGCRRSAGRRPIRSASRRRW
jgi:homoserine O-acetyltransferase